MAKTFSSLETRLFSNPFAFNNLLGPWEMILKLPQ